MKAAHTNIYIYISRERESSKQGKERLKKQSDHCRWTHATSCSVTAIISGETQLRIIPQNLRDRNSSSRTTKSSEFINSGTSRSIRDPECRKRNGASVNQSRGTRREHTQKMRSRFLVFLASKQPSAGEKHRIGLGSFLSL